MILLAAGIVVFGLAYHVFNQTNRLASLYASVWSDCQDNTATACRTEMSTYAATLTMGNIAPQLASANVARQMFQVTMSGGNPTVVFAYPTGATPSADEITAVRATVADGQAGVIVTVRYTHTIVFFPQVMSDYFGGRVLQPTYTVTQLKT